MCRQGKGEYPVLTTTLFDHTKKHSSQLGPSHGTNLWPSIRKRAGFHWMGSKRVRFHVRITGYLKSGVVFGEIFQIHKKENSVAASPNNGLTIFPWEFRLTMEYRASVTRPVALLTAAPGTIVSPQNKTELCSERHFIHTKSYSSWDMLLTLHPHQI